jgi:PAS domain S-box-containing protein
MNRISENIAQKDYRVFYDAINSSISGIVIAGLDGKIQYVNRSFIVMFEYSDDSDVLGKRASDLFARADVKNLSDVEAIIDRETGNTEEFSAHRKDGSTFVVEVSTSTVKDQHGTVVGRMASFIDITQRKAAEEKIRVLSKQLIRSQEIERQRIARDLHDGIAQTLHAAKLNFVAFMKDRERFADRFKVGIECLDKASQELREVCDDLYPTILRDYGLASAISWYAKNYLELQGIEVRLGLAPWRRWKRNWKCTCTESPRKSFPTSYATRKAKQ